MYRLTVAKAPAQREPKGAVQESEAEPKHSAPDLNVEREREKEGDWWPEIPPKAAALVT